MYTCLLLFPLVLLSLIPNPGHCQAGMAYDSSEIVAIREVEPGTIKGVVVNAFDGAPVEGAQVYVVGAKIGDVSDNRGSFAISGVPIGDIEVAAEALGFLTQKVSRKMSPASGLLARFALEEAYLSIDCIERISSLPPAIRLFVLDVLTGRAPRGPTSVTVVDGVYRDSTTAIPDERGVESVLEMSFAQGRPGSYSVSVVNPNYLAWRTRALVVEWTECSSEPMRTVHAWLVPR